MKILIVTTEIGLDGGGLSLSCTKLADVLSRKHTVEIADSTAQPILTASGGALAHLRHSIGMEYKLKMEVEKYKDYDAVIGFGGNFNGYYSSLLAHKINAKYVLSFRGSDINLSKWSAETDWYSHKAIDKADKIVVLSNEMKNNVLHVSPSAKNKVTIIPNVFEGKQTKISFPNLPSSITIGCAASYLNEKKGIANLLCVVSEFKKMSPLPIKLILVGKIDDDLKLEYKQIINDLKLKDNVLLVNKMSRSDLAQTMKNWDFYVQGSVCEGCSNSVMEAFQNGCAFISTKTGFIAEALSPKYPYFFFDSFNPTSMSLSLLKLINLKDKELLYSKAHKDLVRCCNKYIIENKWLEIFDTVPVQRPIPDGIENVIAIGLHDIQGELHDSITTPVAVFEKFVDQIYNSGYGLCSMRDYIAKNAEERKSWIVCTFDDGYKDLNKYALPILCKYGFTASVFICTGLIGKDNKWNNKDAVPRRHLNMDELHNLHRNGWEIASHGVHHYNLLKLTAVEIDSELSMSHDFLVKEWGEAISYAYPYGAYNAFIMNCVGRYYKYAFSVTQGGDSLVADSLQIRRYSIAEIYQMLNSRQ
ncbi:polysaccharide deacetylase family protein [Bacteroides fragilis]|uniref:polysaccharide deacetylase family protein n=1 Tax=Bacteroides fragilis TaxID=817 RepID=UPI0022AA9F37|nr:polysaccharide deacetylase family protein [Bacteroides fragilis]MCZ2695831.1 polysaccharide deacetylase family protein [Bacteroides fragilis]